MALKRFAIDLASLSAGRAVQTLAAFIALPVIARLLGPAEYGLVALAMSFAVLTIFMADAGMGQSLVRTPASDVDTWSTAFWTILAFGAVLSALLIAVAFAAPFLIGEARLTPLLLILSAVPLMVAFLAPATADMQQRQKFRELALFESVSAMTGLVVAIVLALQGFGAWAVVMQQIAFWVTKGAFLLARTQFRPRFIWRRRHLGDHLRFARDNTGSTILYFLGRQIDPLVIGRIAGTVPLGFYALAMRIMALPHQLVSSPVQNALYVRMVELRADPVALKDLYLILTHIVALLVFPAVAVFAAASPAYFGFFLSHEWLASAPIFMCLAPIAALQTVTIPSSALLLATGMTTKRLQQYFELAVIWVIALPISAYFGVVAVACTFTAVNLLYFPRSLMLTLPVIHCGMQTYFRTLMAPVIAAGAVVAVHLGVRASVHPGQLAEISLSVAELAACYAVLLWSCRNSLRTQIQSLRVLMARSDASAVIA